MDETAEARAEAVRAWQRYYGMEPRDDSRLTTMYALGEVDGAPDAVARELVATDFIYQHTPYGELIEDFLRAVAARLRAEHALSWKATWQVVRFYGPIALRLMCLDRCGLRIPDHSPLTSTTPTADATMHTKSAAAATAGTHVAGSDATSSPEPEPSSPESASMEDAPGLT